MTEPDQIEFHEQVTVSGGRRDGRSVATRAGVVLGSAALIVIGAVAAMGASPSAPAVDGSANLLAAAAPGIGIEDAPPLDNGFRGGMLGHRGFLDITISAIDGSSLSLKTDDGWTRTITVGSSTTITKGGATIAVGDLAVGDQIRFTQEKATDGTYSITAIHVVLPTIGGEVSAISGNTITVTGRDGTTGTIHVDGDTTYEVNGTAGKALSDVTVGSFIVAEGTLRADGSLDADAVHSGFRGMRDGDRPGRGFPGMPWEPKATPTPTTTAS
ncbi:MAG TPA: DUF5666 domain-containing protein [Candidatus Limnocylindrales bacterium]|nr:DUF5666 domain-containing protein [Candidatus Limnocylindrales bacterium]